jgi:hypothetical protein
VILTAVLASLLLHVNLCCEMAQRCSHMGSVVTLQAVILYNAAYDSTCSSYIVQGFECDLEGDSTSSLDGVKWEKQPNLSETLQLYTLTSSLGVTQVRVLKVCYNYCHHTSCTVMCIYIYVYNVYTVNSAHLQFIN